MSWCIIKTRWVKGGGKSKIGKPKLALDYA